MYLPCSQYSSNIVKHFTFINVMRARIDRLLYELMLMLEKDSGILKRSCARLLNTIFILYLILVKCFTFIKATSTGMDRYLYDTRGADCSRSMPERRRGKHLETPSVKPGVSPWEPTTVSAH